MIINPVIKPVFFYSWNPTHGSPIDDYVALFAISDKVIEYNDDVIAGTVLT